jgi:hypothetical protein
MQTVQTNVRVAETDKPVIVAIAARLRADPEFRDRLVGLLNDEASPAMVERLKKLEQQVSWLQSGAIVVPRAAAPFMPKIAAAPRRMAGAEND